MSKAEFIEEQGQWVRSDGKQCYYCESHNSTSPELFEVEYEDGEKLLCCSVCVGEWPFSNEPEQIKSIVRVKEVKEQTSLKFACKWNIDKTIAQLQELWARGNDLCDQYGCERCTFSDDEECKIGTINMAITLLKEMKEVEE